MARRCAMRYGKAGGVRRGMGWYVVVWWGKAGLARLGFVSPGGVGQVTYGSVTHGVVGQVR